jgi:hypothetical protein
MVNLLSIILFLFIVVAHAGYRPRNEVKKIEAS